MNIGIVSDTHKNRDLLEKAVAWLTEEKNISMLFHLGDDYEDMSGYANLAQEGVEIIQVPGIYHERYLDGSIEKKQFKSITGINITIVHSLERDIDKHDRLASDIIFYGHTHKPEIVLENGKLFANPGHLKREKDKNVDATFGLLTIEEKDVGFSIFNLDFEEKESVRLSKSESGLYNI